MTTISLDNIQPLIPERLSNSYKAATARYLLLVAQSDMVVRR